jgi:3-hydroxypropanoate dehydrogenase
MPRKAKTTTKPASLVLDEAAQDLLFRQARTANSFSDEPVEDDVLKAIYELVKWGPTSMNQQPLRVVLVRTSEARERLLPYLEEFNRPKSAAAPVIAILAVDLDFHEELPKLFPHFPQAKDVVFADADLREWSGSQNAWLQIGYFIMGVRAAGLNAGPMIGFDSEGVNKEFFGDGKHKALLLCNIGKPGENPWYPRLPRLEYEEVFSEV